MTTPKKFPERAVLRNHRRKPIDASQYACQRASVTKRKRLDLRNQQGGNRLLPPLPPLKSKLQAPLAFPQDQSQPSSQIHRTAKDSLQHRSTTLHPVFSELLNNGAAAVMATATARYEQQESCGESSSRRFTSQNSTILEEDSHTFMKMFHKEEIRKTDDEKQYGQHESTICTSDGHQGQNRKIDDSKIADGHGEESDKDVCMPVSFQECIDELLGMGRRPECRSAVFRR